MKVARLPVDPGPSGWNEILPPQTPPRELSGRQTADWLVIGAGFAGLAAARRLSQLRPGDDIVILEASRVGHGPAGRNSGFMIDLPHDLASADYAGAVEADIARTAANRHAIDFAEAMARAYGLGAEAFARSGKINAAATEKGHQHNLDYAAHLKAMGEAHEMLDAGEMRALTGSGYYRSGLRTPGSAMIQPALFVRGVAAGLVSNRVTLCERSPVTALRREADWVAQTPKGQVTAPNVILAVNGHLESFGYYRNRLMHVFTYASMTRALGAEEVARLGGAEAWGLTPADPLGTTVRKISGTGGVRLVIRNRVTFDPSMEVTPAALARAGADHDRAFAARFPALAGVEMAYRWGGRTCMTRNGVGIVRTLEEGLHAACVQNALGTVRGTLAGMLAAEHACGEASALLDEALTEAAPRRLPPRPIARIGANAYLRWKEARAGREK